MCYKNLSKEQKKQHELEIEEARANLFKFNSPIPLNIIQTEIEKINDFFDNSQWMDLEYRKINHNEIHLHGSIDDKTPDYDEIEIVFFLPQAISTLFYDIDTATKKPFISLITEKEFKNEVGLTFYPNNYIFKLANEDETYNYIVAKGIKSFLEKS